MERWPFSRSRTPLTATVPTDIPEELTAGDTWRWTVGFLTDYPAGDGWVLMYYLRGIGSLDITADADGDDYSVTVDATDTAALAAGNYQFIARAAKSGEVYTVDSGAVVIRPNAATATAGTLQSHAEKMVALLRSEIQARVTGTGTAHNDYTIDSRQISKIPLPELRGMLKGYELELAAQKNGGRLPPYRVTFSRA